MGTLDQIEVVVPPEGRMERQRRGREIYQAAVAAAPDGKAVRVRFESWRDRDGYVGTIQRLARMDGYRANTQSGTNNSVTIWIDMEPAVRRGQQRSPKGA